MVIISAKTTGPLTAIGLVFLLSLAGVIADFALKRASQQTHPFTTWQFVAGSLIYGSTGFAWVLVMKHMKLAILGAFYAVATALLLAVGGVVFFKESLAFREVIGIGLGVASLVLLSVRL
jgi:multidrug transporter EmrE-like cation transporter